MELKDIIRGFTDYKVIVSLIGGIFISSGFPLIGNALWVAIDAIWYNHYKKLNDKVSQVMFAAWFIVAAWGVFYWGWLV